MKKSKIGRLAALLAASSLLFGGFFTSCKSDDDSGGGNDSKDVTPVSVTSHLAKFNAADTVWADSDVAIKGSASSGGKEGYLLLNHKIDLSTENITIEADVSYTSLSGHVGLGFISVDGSNRKGYSMITGQNIKNVSATLGGGGNGLTPSVTWAVGTTYHLKAEFAASSYTEDASTNSVTYTVSNSDGEVIGTNTTPMYYSLTDVVYPALGGTTAENARYSNIKISVTSSSSSINYSFNGLDEQTTLPSLSVSATSLRLMLNNSDTITYTSTSNGESAGVNLDYDNTVLSVTDDGNGTLTITGLKATTSTTLKVINKATNYITASIAIVVEDFNTSDSYGSLSSVYPEVNAASAYEDGEFRITFDNEPTLSSSGSISIYDSDGTWVDTIKASDETLTVGTGNTVNVKDQLIRIDGNSVYFTPHYGVLEAGKTYYIAIPKSTITAKLNSVDFDGLTNNKDNASWKFTTRSAPSVSTTITVDGSESSTADFRTVHGALSAVGSSGDYTINIAPGTYREVVHANTTANVTLAGTGSNARGADTVIQWTNLNKWNGSMDTRAAVYFGSNSGNVVIKNLTIKNTCDRSVVGTADTQAEALYDKSSNKLVVYNSSLLSHQDTICTRGPTWIYDTYIEGDTDFMWGYSDVALFENCEIKCLADSAKIANSAADILFVSRCGTLTKAKLGKGYVLLNSKVTVEDGITAYLGRNAGTGDFYDQIAVVNTEFAVEGTGTVSSDLWSGASVYTYLDGKESKVGLKYYNLTGSITASPIDHVAVISETDYKLEFNGRRAILNRVYVKESDSYAVGSAWDETYLSALESDASAVEDASKDNEYESESDGTLTVEWDFQSMAASAVNIQGTTGTVIGTSSSILLSVDATTGKLTTRGSDAQFNEGTIIKVPVNIGTVVKIVSYPSYHNYTVGGTAASADTTTVTSDKTGYLEIVATNTAYLYSISATYETPVEWDFQSMASSAVNIQGTTGTVTGTSSSILLSVDATSGKLTTRGSDAQFNQGAIIKVPVTKGQKVIVVSYPNYHYYTVGGITASEDTIVYTATETDATSGYVSIVSTNTAYLYSIKLTTE